MNLSAAKAIYAILLITGIGYAFIELRGPNGIQGVLAKNAQVKELEIKNQQLHKDIEAKQQRIIRLRDNPAEQELEIRQKLKLTKKGEKIYILDDAAK